MPTKHKSIINATPTKNKYIKIAFVGFIVCVLFYVLIILFTKKTPVSTPTTSKPTVSTPTVIPPTSKYLKHIKTNKCLDGDGTTFYFNGCTDGNNYQKWLLQNDGLLKHNNSGKCVKMGLNSVSYDTCDTNNASQKWEISNNNLRNPSSGKCFDSNGTALYTNDCQYNNDYQKWSFMDSI